MPSNKNDGTVQLNLYPNTNRRGKNDVFTNQLEYIFKNMRITMSVIPITATLELQGSYGLQSVLQ